MIHCALISDDETLRRHVNSLIRSPDSRDRLVLELNVSAEELARDRISDVTKSGADVAFIDLGGSTVGRRVLEVLSQEAPDMALIAVGPELSADELLQVVRAGASEYLPRPLERDDIAQALKRIRRRASGARPELETSGGQVTTLFSPKGGVGVTTVGVNLAVVLHELTGQSTVLLDLAPFLGTAALSIGLQPKYSYLDLIQNFHRVDEKLFASFLNEHESGIQVLASPASAKVERYPSTDDIIGVIRFCRKHYGHVVIDAGHTLTPAAEAALMEADHRLLVSTPELPALRNLKRVLESIVSPEKNGKAPPRLVLNQYAEGLGVTVAEAEKGLGLEVEAVIDRDASLLSESINLGRPAVHMKRSAFERAVTGLARRIAGDSADAAQANGFLKTLLRPFRSSGSAVAMKEGR